MLAMVNFPGGLLSDPQRYGTAVCSSPLCSNVRALFSRLWLTSRRRMRVSFSRPESLGLGLGPYGVSDLCACVRIGLAALRDSLKPVQPGEA